MCIYTKERRVQKVINNTGPHGPISIYNGIYEMSIRSRDVCCYLKYLFTRVLSFIIVFNSIALNTWALTIYTEAQSDLCQIHFGRLYCVAFQMECIRMFGQ